MKRTVLAIAGTVCGLVMLLSFKTHPADGTGGAAAGTGSSAGTGGAAPSPTSSGESHATGGTRTVTGNTVDTRWGPVQVKVTLENSKITKVEAIRLPSENPRDREINGFAVPQLEQEAMSAQSAHIDMVSGATYTSEGYIESLQSALDKAGR